MKKLTIFLIFLMAVFLIQKSSFALFIVDTGEPFAEGLHPQPVGSDPDVPGVFHFLFDRSQQLAGKFIIEQSSRVFSIEGFMISDLNQPNLDYTISIYRDGGAIPDVNNQVFFQKRFSPLIYNDGYQWDGLSNLDFILDPGSYWVGFEPGDFSGFIAAPGPNPLEDHAFRLHTGGPFDDIYLNSSTPLLSVRIGGESAAVPEPSTFILFSSSLVFLTRRYKNKR